MDKKNLNLIKSNNDHDDYEGFPVNELPSVLKTPQVPVRSDHRSLSCLSSFQTLLFISCI